MSKPPSIHWQRTLRTPHSERLLGLIDGVEAAAVDLHHLPSGAVAGTVVLLAVRDWSEQAISGLLSGLDDDFLPDVDLRQGNLTFTVVVGSVLGNFEAEPSAGGEPSPHSS